MSSSKTLIKDNKKYLQEISSLTKEHYLKCKLYKKFLDNLNYDKEKEYQLFELPFVPVRIFKNFDLKSVDESSIVKTLVSSGTSNKGNSRIFLDKENSSKQIRVLSEIVSSFIGCKRLPMLIFDSESVLKSRKSFSARGAAIMGFSIFGRDITYALNDNNDINFSNIERFLIKHKDETKILFGFTSVIWENFSIIKDLKVKLDFSNSILLHGGGWKKLIEKKVSDEIFREFLKKEFLIKRVINYYGMVEQTGSIFLQCEKCHHFLTTKYSDIFIRDNNFNLVQNGKIGIVQLISSLPSSYPGHNIISEDIGYITAKNNCSCSKYSKRFKIIGRIKDAELRGCSNV